MTIAELISLTGARLTDTQADYSADALRDALARHDACTASCTTGCVLPYVRPDMAEHETRVRFGWAPCATAQRIGRERALARLLAVSQRPAFLAGKTFATFIPRENVAGALAVAREANGRSLVFAGAAGIGKTHLAAAILNRALAQGRQGVFVTVPELMQALRAAQGNDTADKVLELLGSTDLLVLDDLGSERVTDFVTEQLFVIVNARYLRERQTIVTTNYTQPTALSERYGSVAGERIVSRLREMCRWIVLEGEDWRVAPWTG